MSTSVIYDASCARLENPTSFIPSEASVISSRSRNLHAQGISQRMAHQYSHTDDALVHAHLRHPHIPFWHGFLYQSANFTGNKYRRGTPTARARNRERHQ